MLRFYAIFLVLIFSSSILFAQGKVTVDPNINSNMIEEKEEVKNPLFDDDRLNIKVSIKASNMTVSDIIDELMEQSGVVLYAGYNDIDWQVRDRKMVIFAEDVPLNKLMLSIANVMRFVWSVNKAGEKPTYRLYMDRNTLLSAERKHLEQQEKLEKEAQEMREKALDSFSDIANMTPEQLEKLRAENPYLYVSAKTGLAQSFDSIFSQMPSMYDALLYGNEQTINAASLSPSALQSAINAMESLHKIEGIFRRDRNREFPTDIAVNPEKLTININSMRENIGQSPMRNMMLGDINFSYDGRNYSVPIMNPNSDYAKLMGEVFLQLLEGEGNMMTLMQNYGPMIETGIRKEISEMDWGEPEIMQTQVYEDLQNEISLDIKQPSNLSKIFSNTLKALYKETKIPIVSDTVSLSMNAKIPTDKKTAQELIDTIASGYLLNWSRNDEIIEFKDRQWLKKRSAQIPQAWIDKWKNELISTGTMSLDTLCEIASITREQFRENIISNRVFMTAGLWNVNHNRDILKAYASLSENQKAWAVNPAGLNFSNINEYQYDLFKKTFRRNSEYLSLDLSTIKLNMTANNEKVDDEKTKKNYVFKITSTETDKEIIFTVGAPNFDPNSLIDEEDEDEEESNKE